jgi:hypothetical protein
MIGTTGTAFFPLVYPADPLSLRERAGERGSKTTVISYSLILSFSLREKGRSVLSAAIDLHVGSAVSVCIHLYIPALDA